MMKFIKIYSLLSLILLLSINEINAQAPGLLGKKLTIGYDANFSFNVYGEAYKTETQSGYSFGDIINTKHNFNADYILNRGVSLGLDYSLARSGVAIELDDLSANLSMRELGFRLKNFHSLKGGIAPIGFYTQYRMFMLDYETEIIDHTGAVEPITVLDRTAYGLSFAYGHQGIIAANVMYNVGFEMGAAFSDLNFSIDSGTDLLYKTKNVVNWDTFLKFKIGVVVPII